jgi:pimeloyl-ACP methyl ester carboxylesterase
LLWGHSQGGQAVLFAAQEAATYAPDLELVAVAAAAPAVELAALLRDNEDLASGVTLGAYAFDAYQQVYGPTHPEMSLDQVVQPAGVPVVPELTSLCLFGQHKELERIAEPLVGEFIAGDPATVEPWASLLRDNTPGAVRIDAPMFIAQGTSDKLVDPATTRSYVRDMCAAGERVDFHQEPGVGHALVAERAIPDVVALFADALAGSPTRDTC